MDAVTGTFFRKLDGLSSTGTEAETLMNKSANTSLAEFELAEA
jgi:hypothetical protein